MNMPNKEKPPAANRLVKGRDDPALNARGSPASRGYRRIQNTASLQGRSLSLDCFKLLRVGIAMLPLYDCGPVSLGPAPWRR